jgi:acetyl-CoA carboxylase biotin carboxylase subunit
MARETKKFKRVLIANRGEIAVRVARTLREMGISPIAVYSDADRTAPHVLCADYAYHVGPAPSPESYLIGDKILEAAKACGADAIHPGYGFLSENPVFAETVEKAGIAFIGPPPDAMRVMGSKTAARDKMEAAGVPSVETEEEALRVADEIGFPVMLKAAAGGGGKGMRLISSRDELPRAYRSASNEAKNAFGDETVYIEKAVIEPRHIEIQVLSGPDGKAIWLGERECSMQRRHQKIIEETPSVLLDDDIRQKMGEVACRAADAVDYIGAGTVEFLMDRDRNFYFLEMNTRLQVEHPVTELCCGIDLVEAQIRVAQGEPLPWGQDDIVRKGHAVEARIYAEDPEQNFMPSPGLINDLVLPHWPGVRVDCGVSKGYEVSRFYDPMIAKVVAWGEDRDQARRRLRRALTETAVKGITTNTKFLRDLLDDEAFVSGDYHTGSVTQILEREEEKLSDELTDVATVAAAIKTFRRDRRQAEARAANASPAGDGGTWRGGSWRRGGF